MAKKKKPTPPPTLEELNAKPEWTLAGWELRLKRRLEFKARQRQQQSAAARKRQAARPKPSDVTITHADGTVEVRKPYGSAKLSKIISEGNEHLAEAYREHKDGGDLYPPFLV